MSAPLLKKLLTQVRRISGNAPNRSLLKAGFRNAFGKYILLTNTLSSGVLMLIGDMVQQEIEYQKNQLPARYDYGRSTRMFIVGLTQGPLHHYFYGWMDRLMPKRDLKTILKKIGLDQFIMSPVCITSFFYTLTILELKPIGEGTREIADKFIQVYTVDWVVWPPTQFINFYFLPVKYQVIYINFMTMLYNVFLSYIKHREVAKSYEEQQKKSASAAMTR